MLLTEGSTYTATNHHHDFIIIRVAVRKPVSRHVRNPKNIVSGRKSAQRDFFKLVPDEITHRYNIINTKQFFIDQLGSSN